MTRLSRLKRRRFLVVAGLTATIAGCTGSEDENGDEDGEDENGDEDGEDENGDEDGEDENGTDDVDIDAPHPTDDDHGYGVVTDGDADVPVVPLEDALEWHEEELVAFLDARGSEDSHENARIPGSVWSEYPAETDDDPVDDWESDDPIVVYSNDQGEDSLCVLKAAELIGDGYEYVYVMDTGFTEWRDRGYPMDGLGPDGELEGEDDE